jgi:hypothetical protein
MLGVKAIDSGPELNHVPETRRLERIGEKPSTALSRLADFGVK